MMNFSTGTKFVQTTCWYARIWKRKCALYHEAATEVFDVEVISSLSFSLFSSFAFYRFPLCHVRLRLQYSTNWFLILFFLFSFSLPFFVLISTKIWDF
jgi:hypothetical protein